VRQREVHRTVVALGTARRTHPLLVCTYAFAILSYIAKTVDVVMDWI